MSTEFKPGLYEHYKTGGLYSAICLVTHHETREPMVLYVSLSHGSMNVRPLNGWTASGDENKCHDVDGWNDVIVVDGMNVRRFTYIGPLSSTMPAKDRAT